MASILVIDDDAAVLGLLRRVLEHAGHDVSAATEGSAGMQAYRAQKFDLVITDLYMPEQDGIETIQQIREHDATCPILAISGDGPAGGDALRDAHLLGADAVLAKPFGVGELLATVDELLSS